MKKLILIELIVLGILFYFLIQLNFIKTSTPDVLIIFGLDKNTFLNYNLSILNPFYTFIYIFTMIINLSYLANKIHEGNGLFEMMLYRSGRKSYFITKLKSILIMSLKNISILYVIALLYRAIKVQISTTNFFDYIVYDLIFLAKLLLLLVILLSLYEFVFFNQKNERNLLFGILNILLILGVDISFNKHLLTYSLVLDIAIRDLMIGFILSSLIILFLYKRIKNGDLV